MKILDYQSLQNEPLAALIDIGRGNCQALLATWSKVEGNQRAYLAYILGEAGCSEGLSVLQDGLLSEDNQLCSNKK